MRRRKRITVDVTGENHHAIKAKAAKLGRTISDIVRELLSRWLGQESREEEREDNKDAGD